MSERNKLLMGAQVAAYDLGFEDCLRSFNLAAGYLGASCGEIAELAERIARLRADNARLTNANRKLSSASVSSGTFRAYSLLALASFLAGAFLGRLL